MNDLNILKEVGIKEVSRKTHIGPEYLECIINKDFEKLVRINVHGYIKILQREYGLDLSEWQNEFDEFCKEYQLKDIKRTTITPKIKSYTGSPTTLSGGFAGWLLWLVLIAGFAVAAYYFEAHNYIEKIPSFFDDKNMSVNYSDNATIKELSKNILINEKNISNIDIQSDFDTNVSISITIPTKSNDNNTSAILQTPQIKLSDESMQDMDKNQSEKTTQKDQISVDTTTSSLGELVAKTSKAKILPKSNVWLGVIDLKTKAKKSLTTSKEYELDMSGEYLVICGNGNVVLHTDSGTKSFDGSRAARFIVSGGEIRLLTYDEFVSLNGGKSW
ncbi:phosphatidylglycerophosphate synthase [Campylobacter majalis]|uniref:phosphatidylglycerophosphate synthase n=1 Tax=Campylobacter majalis TaxID=2790656 RepID=UPI003D6994BE